MSPAFRTSTFTFFFFQLKDFGTEETTNYKKVKLVKESIMIDKIIDQDIESTAKNIKSSEEAMKVVKEMEKKLEVTSAVFYGLPTNKIKYLKDLKLNHNFINMVNQFGNFTSLT